MRKSLLAVLALVAASATLGGCVSLLPKTAPAQLYRFGAESALPSGGAPNGTSVGPSGAGKIGVVLGHVEFPRASTSDGILTVTGDQTAYIAGARWVAPARQQFQEAVERAFDARAKGVQIVDVGDVGSAGAVLRMDILSFEARYPAPGAKPTIVVALAARLTRSDGRVLDQREFSASIPAEGDRVSLIVKAFNQAVAKILADIVVWTDQEVPSAPAADAPSPAMTATTSTTSTSQTVTEVQH